MWTVAGGLLLALAAVYWKWAAGPELADLGGDNAYYMLIAESFVSAKGGLAEFFRRQTDYPPLFPGLLAATGSWRTPLEAHVVVALCYVAGFSVFALWLRSARFPPVAWCGIPVVFALLPGTYTGALSIHSEGLFTLLSIAALACLERYERAEPGKEGRGRRRRWLVLAGACAGAALLTRTAGLPLLAAGGVGLLMRRRYIAALGWMGAVIPALGWRLFGGQIHGGYLNDFALRLADGPGQGASDAVLRELGALVRALDWYLTGRGEAFTVFSVAFALIALAVVACRAFRARFDALYAGAYAAMLLVWTFVWPSEAGRLLAPLMPILIRQWAEVGRFVGRRVAPPRRTPADRQALPQWGLLVLGLVALAPNLVLTAQRYSMSLPGELEPFRHSRWLYGGDRESALERLRYQAGLVEALRDLPRHVPPGECVYAGKPSLVGFYGRRESRDPPRPGVGPAEFRHRLRDGRCRYVLGINMRSPTFPIPFYPLERLEAGARRVEVWPRSPREGAERRRAPAWAALIELPRSPPSEKRSVYGDE